jgi:uncharacterized protein
MYPKEAPSTVATPWTTPAHRPITRTMRNFVSVPFTCLLILCGAVATTWAATTDRAAEAIQKGDFQTALSEVRPLASQGDPNAQFLLGMLYDSGQGVPQDHAAAAAWYRKAAEQDHVLAQVYLGVLLCMGQGVKRDYGKAARCFRKPAESGNDVAQFYLGALYAEGNGVEKSGSEAIHWLTKSAAQRNTRAMGLLAVGLFSRARDDQDLIDAYVWSHLAADLDPIQAATSARKVIEKYCNAAQKKQGKARVAEWQRQWASEDKAAAAASR